MQYLTDVTPTQVLDTLRDVVQGREAYVYTAPNGVSAPNVTTCHYVHGDAHPDGGDTPGCVVGHVLNRLGVPLSVLSRYEGTRAANLIDYLAGVALTPSDTYIRVILDRAQYCQDDGGTWGEALARAEVVPLPPETL